MIDRALGPDSAPMPLNHALDRGQADAGAAKLALIVQPFEGGKQIGGARHVESCPVVPHEIGSRAVALRQGAKFNPRPRALGRELPRVANQILQHHSQQPRVALDGQPLGNDPIHQAVRVFLLQFSRDGFGQGAQIDPVQDQLVTGHIGQTPAGHR